MKDEALKLALEALEWTLPLIEDFGNKEQLNKQHKAIASLYEAQAQPAQKTATGIQYAQGIPFFIPPQRPCVELTDEEIIEIRQKTFDAVATNYEVYRAIEAKLKEKNS